MVEEVGLKVGCFKDGMYKGEASMRVIGLLVFLWDRVFFK